VEVSFDWSRLFAFESVGTTEVDELAMIGTPAPSFPWALETVGALGVVIGSSMLKQVWRTDYVIRTWQRNSLLQSGLLAASLPSVVAWTLMFIDLGLLSVPLKHHSIPGVVQLVLVITTSSAIILFFIWAVVAFLACERLPSRFRPPCLR
jgi:hypothetical protein